MATTMTLGGDAGKLSSLPVQSGSQLWTHRRQNPLGGDKTSPPPAERRRDLLCLLWWDNQNRHIWELGELRGEGRMGRCWPCCTSVAAGLEKAGAGVRTVLGPHLP